MKKLNQLKWVFAILLIATQFVSCKKDDPADPEVIASFTFQVDAADYMKVAFTNSSSNYSALSWNFGDNSAASTETNPVHTYAAAGEYTVVLTATSTNGSATDTFSQKVTISDPNAELTKLVGETSKTWKLIRDVSTHRFPLEVGPADFSTIWWAMGNNNDELANRPCMLNDEWTFNRDGSMVYDAKGDYWAEGGLFDPDNTCASTDQMVGPNGEDLSAWGSGTHSFTINAADAKLSLVGTGAFLGLCKVATDAEVTTPQEGVTYSIIQLTDGDVDTLIVQTSYMAGDTPAYWRFVLVHYDNPNDEPPIPANQPSAAFTAEQSGLTVTFTNSSNFADSYAWDFGDGGTSTEMNPTYTYADEGLYTVTLTATNAAGSNSLAKNLIVSATTLTDELLQGAPWRVRVDEKTVFVGPGLGNSDWWALPKSFLDGSAGGGDDWSCMPDDEFTFSAGGVYTYETMGSARNDGYFGAPNGCISDEEIAASGNGAAFGSGTHTYTFTPATADSRAIITLTNGADRAAFLGFYKGYFGGENSDNAIAPNGGNPTNTYEVMGYAKSATKEYLFVSVDISADHSGGAAWSVILER